MKRFAYLMTAGLLALSAGCGSNHYARQIIQPRSPDVWMAMTGSGAQLVERGFIDSHQRISTTDGIPLDVWVIRNKAEEGGDSRGTVIILHGLHKHKAYHLRLGQMLTERGFDAVLIDLRAHGRSGGEFTTYGAKEKHDVKRVMDRLVEQGMAHKPFYAFGETLGATVALQYAAIDDRVRGVVADAPYPSFRSQALRTITFSAPTMGKEDFSEVIASAARMGDFDPNEVSSIEAVKKLHCPVLLVHGFLTQEVPKDQVRQVYDAAKEPKKIVTDVMDRSDRWMVDQIDDLAKNGLTGSR